MTKSIGTPIVPLPVLCCVCGTEVGTQGHPRTVCQVPTYTLPEPEPANALYERWMRTNEEQEAPVLDPDEYAAEGYDPRPTPEPEDCTPERTYTPGGTTTVAQRLDAVAKAVLALDETLLLLARTAAMNGDQTNVQAAERMTVKVNQIADLIPGYIKKG